MSNHYRPTLRLALPIAAGQLGVIILAFADTMMVGRYGTQPLAAASFVNSLFNLVVFLLTGYSYGFTPLVSQLYGRGREASAGAMLKQALTANGLFAAVVLGGMTTLYFFLDSFGQPAELLPLIRPYYAVVLVSMVFVMLFGVLRQLTDGSTDTLSAMWILLVGNALNILGNWVLIYGYGPFPEWGLTGAGVSTLVSRILMVAALAGVLLFRRRYRPYRQGFGRMRLSWRRIKDVHRVSLPVALQVGMETGAFTCTTMMAGWLGALELAGLQVVFTVSTVSFMIFYSFGSAMSIRVATFYGRQDFPALRQATAAGRNLLLLLATAGAALFLLLGRPLLSLFTEDAAVIVLGATLLAPLAFYQFGDALQICYAHALRGTAQVKSMMWIAAVSYLLLGIPASYVMGFVMDGGLRGVFLGLPVGLCCAAALYYRAFRRHSTV